MIHAGTNEKHTQEVKNITVDDADDMELDEGAEQDALQDDANTAGGEPPREVQYRKRAVCKVIRYRHCELDDVYNCQREMVTLFVPFGNEVVDVLDENNFIQIYDTTILEARKDF